MPVSWTLAVVGFALLVLLLFLPRRGALARWRRWQAHTARERLEDALKLLLDHEWQHLTISPGALSAALRLPERRGLQLAERLQSLGLVTMQGNALRLTPEGQRAALQVTRAHRLLERYLADEARMPLQQIHRVAHRMEHRLTPGQVDELDAALGFPRRDPHGDPIPAPHGSLPPLSGVPLTDWEVGQPGVIAQIEDEPPLACAQILAEGLAPGQVVQLLEKTPRHLLLTNGENEVRLAPAVAGNLLIKPLPAQADKTAGALPLDRLPPHQRGEIVALDEACQGFTRRRFLDLGLTPGTVVTPELLNAFGDPRAYRLRGTLIALRRDQAAQIWVRPLPLAE
jgi:DtxR family Mn-dependent transcriptional regulator